MKYRELKREEIEKMNEIDRREVINQIYYYRNGRLELEEEHYDMRGFPNGELEDLIERQYEIYDKGGCLYGAFEGSLLIGVTSIDNKLIGQNKNYLKMDILFVSHDFRKLGIGAELIELVKGKAIEFGGKKLYISATPSKNTVDFYMRNGAVLVKELNQELYELEPEDIHLEITVQ
ncbi:GNAT family N-acetyltransferase [Vallitalea okinawensis]|uniref:GNAT family N-acetyltransferase n=1 Tax=Vallitalea okinawensis TaxID=2078660 RepID=UPI000CFB7E36|nr:GNAT family N-acetyltransferase [Vallitalea okinawensis]